MKHKHTNLPETCRLPVCSSSSGGQKYKRRVKSCNLSKESEKSTSTELLLGIYLTKLNEEERRRKDRASSLTDLVRGKRPHEPRYLSPPLPFLLQGSLSVTDSCVVVWAHLDFSCSILSPFTPLHILHFSPTVLLFQLTKRLTRS